MRSAILIAATCLLAAPALAQNAPPASAPPSNGPDASRTTPPPPPAGGPRGRGAFIKLEGPGGATIAVRCADGESTSACADVVTDLLDKVKAKMRPDRGGDDYRGGADQNWRRDDRGAGRRWDHDD